MSGQWLCSGRKTSIAPIQCTQCTEAYWDLLIRLQSRTQFQRWTYVEASVHHGSSGCIRLEVLSRQTFGTRMAYRETFFVNPPASSLSPYPGGFNSWIPNVTEHISPQATSERQTPDTTLDPRCQSGPSARNSFDPNEGRFSKDYGADQQRLQISDLHFDKFPTPATFACWKIRFKTEVCTCSQFPTEAMLWIKEVEMVDSWMIKNLRAL